jgi:hypothetical protein
MVLRKLGILASAVGFLVVAAGQPAHAALVTFQTSGVFGSTGSNIWSGGGITVTFDGVLETQDATDPGWFGSFGTFTVTGGNPATGNINDTFTLIIDQTAPLGQTSFSATYTGNININNSTATVVFSSPLTKEIAGFFYSILNANGEINLPAPGDTPNTASISGHVIHLDDNGDPPPNGIPEPGSLALLGFGLLALNTMNRSRRRR